MKKKNIAQRVSKQYNISVLVTIGDINIAHFVICSKINISQFLVCVMCGDRKRKQQSLITIYLILFRIIFHTFKQQQQQQQSSNKKIKLESMMIVSAADSYDAFNIDRIYTIIIFVFFSLWMINAECVCVCMSVLYRYRYGCVRTYLCSVRVCVCKPYNLFDCLLSIHRNRISVAQMRILLHCRYYYIKTSIKLLWLRREKKRREPKGGNSAQKTIEEDTTRSSRKLMIEIFFCCTKWKPVKVINFIEPSLSRGWWNKMSSFLHSCRWYDTISIPLYTNIFVFLLLQKYFLWKYSKACHSHRRRCALQSGKCSTRKNLNWIANWIRFQHFQIV